MERRLGSEEVIETLAVASDHTRDRGASAIRQRSGIIAKSCGGGCAQSGGAALHQAGQRVGEWLLREFQRKLREECLNAETFYPLREPQIGHRTMAD